jgi:hypothetical protein
MAEGFLLIFSSMFRFFIVLVAGRREIRQIIARWSSRPRSPWATEPTARFDRVQCWTRPLIYGRVKNSSKPTERNLALAIALAFGLVSRVSDVRFVKGIEH